MLQKTDLLKQAEHVQLIIFDIDGVMSDGGITYSSNGEESKSFNVQDGVGIKLLQQANIDTAIITGRKSAVVERRAKELGIKHLIQGRDDKLIASKEIMALLKLKPFQVAYMGDDLPDLSAIQYVGLGICPSNACLQVKNKADFITQKAGGHGAVREACEFILTAQSKFDSLIEKFYLTD